MLLRLPDSIHVLSALIDSGAKSNLISLETVQRLSLPTKEFQHPMRLQAINGVPIGEGLITMCMHPLNIQVSTLHIESIALFITCTTHHALILGVPCLQTHDPLIS